MTTRSALRVMLRWSCERRRGVRGGRGGDGGAAPEGERIRGSYSCIDCLNSYSDILTLLTSKKRVVRSESPQHHPPSFLSSSRPVAAGSVRSCLNCSAAVRAAEHESILTSYLSLQLLIERLYTLLSRPQPLSATNSAPKSCFDTALAASTKLCLRPPKSAALKGKSPATPCSPQQRRPHPSHRASAPPKLATAPVPKPRRLFGVMLKTKPS